MNDLNIMNSSSFRYKPIDGYIQEYFNKTHVSYQYNLSGNSINATLYKLDLENSTVSEGAGTKYEQMGRESPYKYIEVTNVPLFNVTRLDIPLGWTEDNGYSVELRLEATVQPSIVPIEVDDYIILNYSSYKNLWRVVECNPDSFEEIYYSKITLMPTQYTSENIAFQVIKRMAYIFESGAVIDRLTNDTLNDILENLRSFYKSFLAEFYAKQGVFIDRKILNSLPTKFFNFKMLPNDVIVYNYFFKKYIATSLITVYIEHKERLNVFFNFNTADNAFGGIINDEVKLLYKFMENLEDNKHNSIALEEAFVYIEDMRKDLLLNEPNVCFDKFNKPYNNIYEEDSTFYRTLIKTFKDIENTDIIIDPNSSNTVRIIANIKKLIKHLSNNHSDGKIVKSFLLFYLIRSIPFKNVIFTNKDLSYGE